MTSQKKGGSGKRNSPTIIICKRSFFSAGTAMHAKKRVRRSHGALISVCLLLICSVIISTIYAGSSAKAQALQQVQNNSAPLAEPPVHYEEITFLSVIPYETVTCFDPEQYTDVTVVLTEGREGLRRVTQTVEYSGDATPTNISVTSTILVEAINEEIAVGTLERPAAASFGTYVWPANGKLSSGFGQRSVDIGSKNHQGIDISGKKGDSICAADGGEVILADSSLSGYGMLVQILHDNGDVTYYAHNSELLVEVGQRVIQGEEIAKMGETGVSSGVHCHFELRIDGVPVDPVEYLP